MVSPWLKIEDLLNPVLGEDVVVPANSFLETQTPQQVAELVKGNVGVRCTAQDAGEKFVVPGHTESYTIFNIPCITFPVTREPRPMLRQSGRP